MPILYIALGIGWVAALVLAERLLVTRGRLLAQTARQSTPQQPTSDRPRKRRRQDAGSVYLEEFGLHLGPEHRYFLNALSEAHTLKQVGAHFWRDGEDRLLCEVAGVTIVVRSVEEMWILREIFVDEIYDVGINRPALVWDIGMNVGMASLYFAARGYTRVVGYEPIGTTYTMALENLALNPSLRDVITTVNSGVGGSNRTEMVEYCDELKGSVGVFGAVADPVLRQSALHLPSNTPIHREELRMEDAPSVFASIRAAHPHVPMIAKIDCEGAEYEIIDALHRNGDLSSLHAVLIEWHRYGPEPMQRYLREAGFTVFSLGWKRGPWGRLYAVQNRVKPS